MDRVRIAILENELLGITPPPGSAAAAAVNLSEGMKRLQAALAQPVDPVACPHGDVVDTTDLSSARATGLCTACGAGAVAGDDGAWRFP